MRRDRAGIDRTVRVVPHDDDLTRAETVAELAVRLARGIRSHPPLVIVDLSRVTAVDTKLIAALVAMLRVARRSAVPVRIIRSENVDHVLRLCRLDGLLDAGTPAEG